MIPSYLNFRSNKKFYVSFDALLEEEAKLMRVKTPTISVNEIIRCLESEHPEIGEIGVLKRSTLQAHLMKSGFSRGALLRECEKDGRAFYGRYRKEHRLEQVQGDVKEPLKHSCVDDETGLPVVPYLQLWMDNATRKILTYRIGVNQTQGERFKFALDKSQRTCYAFKCNLRVVTSFLKGEGDADKKLDTQKR